MDNKEITQNTLDAFERYLREDEKSKATIEKYLRDVRHFMEYQNFKRTMLSQAPIPCLHP